MRNYNGQRGFTYIGLIILVAIIGLVAVSALQVGAITQRRQAEQELLAIGSEYVNALKSYAMATPAGQSGLPARLEDLLLDPRYPSKRRHLRRLYIDPLTGNNEWGIVQGTSSAGTGIIGIYSLSNAKPIKVDHFDLQFAAFKGKKTYHDWVFTAQPPVDDSAPPPAPDVAPPVPSNSAPLKPGKK